MDETQPLLAHDSRIAERRPVDESKLVEFAPEGDRDNPLEWSAAYKVFIVFLLAYNAFIVTFTCIAVVPVANGIVHDLDGRDDKSKSVLLVTIWELGEAAGPLLWAPLSELYGRYPVYNAANLLFIGAVAAAAGVQGWGSGGFIAARFLTGLSVASNALNPSIIGDMFAAESRGSAMSLIMLAPLLGGAVGPAVAGAVVESATWRHVLWMSVALAGAAELAFLALFKETYRVRVLKRRAARLRRETGDEGWKTAYEVEADEQDTHGHAFWHAVARPFAVFARSAVLQAMALYGAVVFSFFYVMSTSLPDILQERYGYDAAQTGLCFLSFSAGAALGVGTCNALLDRVYVWLSARKEGGTRPVPENRLPLVLVCAFALPLALLLYGWAAEGGWPVGWVLFATGAIGYWLILLMVPVMAYVVDAFGLYSASAMTGVLITRCLMSTFFPLATVPLTARFGYGWGFVVLAAVCVAVMPLPMLVFRYGGRWRQHCEYTRDR